MAEKSYSFANDYSTKIDYFAIPLRTTIVNEYCLTREWERNHEKIRMKKRISIFWFRRDLRLEDNAGLYRALTSEYPVLPIFIFDKEILDKLENKEDARVEFIYDTISEIKENLEKEGSSLLVTYSKPLEAFKQILQDYDVAAVYTNEDYEPYATERDEAVEKLLTDNDISFHSYKDQVIFSKDEVLKDDGTPYKVFTPYSKVWKAKLNDFYRKPYPAEKYFKNFVESKKLPLISLKEMGFAASEIPIPDRKVKAELLNSYGKKRNFPAAEATSRLGIHLRFGTLSIRKLLAFAEDKSTVFVNELIWREFYMMILWHFPKVGKGHAFRAAYDNIEWEHDEEAFKNWCEGKTGYPIVDAGMRELNATGFMHNRVRMITASFLCKHLLLDWRLGEAYFAEKLLDFDLSANNGGWQWSSSSGCDSAPYFRVFNPQLQLEKFDKNLEYVKKWVPEYGTKNYPEPIVDHKFARERVLERYKKALDNK